MQIFDAEPQKLCFNQGMGKKPMKTELMNWIPTQKRWARMLNGRRIFVSPRQLGCEATKEGSRDAANLFWRKIESDHFASCQINRQWEKRAIEEALHSKGFLPNDGWQNPVYGPIINRQDYSPEIKTLIGMAVLGKDWTQLHGAPETILPQLTVVPTDETMKAQVLDWLKKKENEVKNGKIKPGAYRNYPSPAQKFADWYGNDKSSKELTSKTVEAYHQHLTQLPFGSASKKAHWVVFGMIVDYLYQHEFIELPRNLRTFSFSQQAVKKDLWTGLEWKAEYDAADDFGKLVLCLAGNCGFYGSDMANLDYDGGSTITRKRTKTHKKSPEVTFTLWPETQELMSKCGAKLVGMWSRTLEADGKVKSIDRIGKYAASHFAKSIKWLRHTSCQALHDSTTYKTYKNTFLCNKSSDMSDKVYSNPIIPREVSDFLHKFYFGS